jgi:hypothetical protein
MTGRIEHCAEKKGFGFLDGAARLGTPPRTATGPTRPRTGDDRRDRLSRLRCSRQDVRVYGLVSRRPSLENL